MPQLSWAEWLYFQLIQPPPTTTTTVLLYSNIHEPEWEVISNQTVSACETFLAFSPPKYVFCFDTKVIRAEVWLSVKIN